MNTSIADLYVSRTERGSAIIARQEPTVYEDGTYAKALTHEQVNRYERDGFLVLDELFSMEEVNALLAEIDRLGEDEGLSGREELITEPDSNALRSIFLVHKLSEKIAELVRDPRVLNVARQILGSEVYVHQSRANLKLGFKGKEFYWHSDFETWHVEDGMPSMRALSCSVLLTDNNACNGPLMLVPGSHKQFIACEGITPRNNYERSLKKQEVGVPDPLSLKLLVDNGGIHPVCAKAGSVVFFDCNTMHASSGNLSPWPRANVFTVYNSVENTLQDPKYGLDPRPEHIATREGFEVLRPSSELVS